LATPNAVVLPDASMTGMETNRCFPTIPKRIPVSSSILLLEVGGELLIAFRGDDGERDEAAC
jgi:hypothetical protein